LAGKAMIRKSIDYLKNFIMNTSSIEHALPVVSNNVRIRWWLRRWIPMLGWPGMLAIGLAAISLSFYVSTLYPLKNRLKELNLAEAANKEKIKNDNAKAVGGGSPSEQLDAFYSHFPKEADSPKWLGKLALVAESNGLKLTAGEYKVTNDKSGQLIRYKITLPVKGKYSQIRKFLSSLSTEIPYMALENVQFERNKIIESDVQANVNLVLYLEQGT
jgi:Tfp pilus assembly protein PilO